VSQKELAIGCCESESASISHDSVAMCLRYGEIFNRTLHLPDFFFACYAWPWLGLFLAATRYFVYFRFYG